MKKLKLLMFLGTVLFLVLGFQSCKDDDTDLVTSKPTECRLISLDGFGGEYNFEYKDGKIVKIKDGEDVYDIEYDGNRYKKMEMKSDAASYEWTFVYEGNKVVRVNKKEDGQDREYREYTWLGDDLVKLAEYVNFSGSYELDFIGNMTYSNNNLISFESGEMVDDEFESEFSLTNIKVDDKINPLYKFRELFLVLDIGVFFNFSKNNIKEAGVVTDFLPFPINVKFNSEYNDNNLPIKLDGNAGGFDLEVNFKYSCN